ncbi:MAG: XTP/dITP diphosphatase [Candidatus Eisenbacteria bacterium]
MKPDPFLEDAGAPVQCGKDYSMQLLLSSHNRDKSRELAHALLGLPIDVRTLDDVGDWPEVEETGTTLEENALIKARAGLAHFGIPTLADDTGLEVDALNGAPGVYSARFAGPDATYADNVNKMLTVMAGVPEGERSARFRCVIAILDPDGRETVVSGEVSGRMLTAVRGDKGFGYDPIFFVPETGKTFAEMSLEEKREVSHRGRALAKARAVLQEWYDLK